MQDADSSRLPVARAAARHWNMTALGMYQPLLAIFLHPWLSFRVGRHRWFFFSLSRVQFGRRRILQKGKEKEIDAEYQIHSRGGSSDLHVQGAPLFTLIDRRS